MGIEIMDIPGMEIPLAAFFKDNICNPRERQKIKQRVNQSNVFLGYKHAIVKRKEIENSYCQGIRQARKSELVIEPEQIKLEDKKDWHEHGKFEQRAQKRKGEIKQYKRRNEI